MQTSQRSPTEGVALAILYVLIAASVIKTEILDTVADSAAPAAGDLLAYYYPTLKYGFSELRSGRLPLWNPYQSCGSPFIAALHQGFFYPLYAPFLVINAEQAVTVHIVLHLALASLGMFLLCRHSGMHIAAALLAGIVYSYQGSMMIKVYFPDFLTSSAWIPWLFLTVDRILQQPSGRRAAALAVVLGLSFLGGHGVQFAYFTVWALLPLILVRTVAQLRREGARAVATVAVWLLLGVGAGVLLGMVRLVPSADFVRQSWRPPGNLPIEASASMPFYPRVFQEGLLTPEPSPVTLRFHPHNADKVRAAYVGTVSLVLAVLGVALWRPRGVSFAVLAAGLAAVLYSFGTASFVFPLLFRLPAGNWFRGVDRALIIFGFAVAFLSGAGVDALLRRTASDEGNRQHHVWYTILLILLAVIVVTGFGLTFGAPRGVTYLVAYGLLVAGALVLLVTTGSAHVRVGSIIVLTALVLFDLLHAQQQRGPLPSQLDRLLARNDDFYDAVRLRQGLDRTYTWASFDERHPLRFHLDTAKAGLLHGIWMATDYEPLSSARFARYLQQLGPVPMTQVGYVDFRLNVSNIRFLDLMGVRFFLLDDTRERALLEDFPELALQLNRILHRDGLSLYEYKGAMPRAFVVEQVEVVADADQLLQRLREVDLRSVALVEEQVSLGPPAPGVTEQQSSASTEVVEYTPNRVVIRVSTPTGGLLVLTDQYDDGWRATVDGEVVKIYRTDFLFRGVIVPAGTHQVVFSYRPRALLVGAIASAVGLVLTVGLAARGTTERWSH